MQDLYKYLQIIFISFNIRIMYDNITKTNPDLCKTSKNGIHKSAIRRPYLCNLMEVDF